MTGNDASPGESHEQRSLSAQSRRQIVEAVRRGTSQHEVARRLGISQPTVRYWVQHARGKRLDRVDWEDQPPIPRTMRRTPAPIEDLILDNLKAAVKKADWFDPEINPKVRSFGEHYGTMFLPTRPSRSCSMTR